MPNRRLPTPPVPSTPAPINGRQKLLEAAGLDDPRQATLLRRAVEQAEGALDAMARVVSPLGTVVELGPDWHARLNAAKMLVSLLGAAPSKSAGAPVAVQTIVNVELPEWAQRAAVAQARGRVTNIPRERSPSETPGVQPGHAERE